jgi:hypothetical protein
MSEVFQVEMPPMPELITINIRLHEIVDGATAAIWGTLVANVDIKAGDTIKVIGTVTKDKIEMLSVNEDAEA